MSWVGGHHGFSRNVRRIDHHRGPQSRRSLVVLLAVLCGPFIGLISPAHAGVGFATSPTFPSALQVGATGVPATINIENHSTAPNDANPITIQPVGFGPYAITLVPSCGSPFPSGTGDCASPDPGVFRVSASAVGEAGTGCAGTTFTITVVDATGKLAFAPSTPVVLQPPGEIGAICRINFTFDVLKSPTVDSNPVSPGLQTSQVVFAQGVDTVRLESGFGGGTSSVTVLAGAATMVTTATPQVAIGSAISDTATVVGDGLQPTGTVTFNVYGPNDPTCAGAQLLIPPRVVPLSGGPPPAANSGPFTPTAVGTYRWVAVYSGDANYTPGTSPCGAPNEASVVASAQATIVTAATTPVTFGSPISDTATVTGAAAPAPAPTGTVTFILFGPNDPICAGPQLLVPPRVVPIAGGPPATAKSGPFTPSAVGTYNWVAIYSGDANYNPVTSPCGAPSEASVVVVAEHDVPADFDGNGTTDISVFRPGATAAWYIRNQAGAYWGTTGDIPVPGDYDGNGTTDVAVFRPGASAGWFIQGQVGSYFGTTGDIPVPGDYDGNGTTDIAVFRPSQGAWYIQGQTGAYWGIAGDIPVPGDYDGNGTADIAVFRPGASAAWYIRGGTSSFWGTTGDIPVPGDYDGNGTTDLAVYQPGASSAWFIKGQPGAFWGTTGDIPVPGRYDANATTDIAVYRPGVNSAWYIQGQAGAFFGTTGDIPLPLPYAIRSVFFP